MREEIRPINRLFVRFWMNKTDIQLPDYDINYTCKENFSYEYILD